jgi:histidinol-phosphate/aromatic aminotransferase/cobyric acid decarboxylase-like protein
MDSQDIPIIKKDVETAIYDEEQMQKICSLLANAKRPFIIAGNGMDNILEATARLLLSPGDKTIIHTPTFEYYEIVTKWAYAEPVFIETKAENNFKLNIEELLNQIDSKTKLIFLCNPNNPTGNSFEWAEIKEILQKAEKFGATVFLDEAYGEFAENSYINQVLLQLPDSVSESGLTLDTDCTSLCLLPLYYLSALESQSSLQFDL